MQLGVRCTGALQTPWVHGGVLGAHTGELLAECFTSSTTALCCSCWGS